MAYSVYQHWDKLKTTIVGISYPPQFYDYIGNEKVRKVFYRIAEETEEDYQKLITLLKSFNVEILRPNIEPVLAYNKYLIKTNQKIPRPVMMQPRDFTIMLGKSFFHKHSTHQLGMEEIYQHIKNQGNLVDSYKQQYGFLNGAMTMRIGKDLYIGYINTKNEGNISETTLQGLKEMFIKRYKLDDYRINITPLQGHTDGYFCPVVPNLIISISEFADYEHEFPGWEIIKLPDESWHKMESWMNLKNKNRGKWWVPGEEYNDDFTDFVETWMSKWVGYVEESVFDVNMLVIDRHNVVVNGYNKLVFDAFSRYNITPHICNFRHRYFWDGGLHCITSDLNREGVMQDYFPERINTSY